MKKVYNLNIERMIVNFPDKLIRLLDKEMEPFNDIVDWQSKNLYMKMMII